MQLVVHRGTNVNCPENSICGIKEIRKVTEDAIIEIDIVPTKDNKLVLFHDLSLMRLCGIDKLVFEFTFDELNTIQKRYEFIELEDILKLFPTQKFLLDIRCNYHIDFFLESKIDLISIKEDLFAKYKNRLLNINTNNMIIICSDLEMAKRFINELDINVDLSENFMREYLKYIEETSALPNLDFKFKRVSIQNKFLTHKIVNIFHQNNIEVFSTPSMFRSIENSKTMLQTAKKYNCDGIWLSPINKEIIEELKE